MLSRRGVLLGGAATLSATAGLAIAWPELSRDQQHDAALARLAAEPRQPRARLAPLPPDAPGPVVEDSFVSRFRGGVPTRWSVALPPGTDPARDTAGMPVVIALHGVHRNQAWVNGPRLGLPRFLAAAVHAGVRPFAVAAVNGGNTYWHPHHGTDSSAMVREELIPILRDRGFDTDRLALMGWSMGGYGVLRLAGLMGPTRVVAVSAASPALWTDPRKASPVGFDGPREYLRYSIMHRQRSLLGIPVKIDVGRNDRFHDAVVSYAAGFPRRASLDFEQHPGAHNLDFWRRRVPAQLRFLARALHT